MPQRELDEFVHYKVHTVTFPAGAPAWVDLPIDLPSGRLRFWLHIPHPDFDFEIKFGNGPAVSCTDDYKTPFVSGFGKTMNDEIQVRHGLPILVSETPVAYYVFFSATPDFGN